MNSMERFERWHKETPFGLFIHWGVYSITRYHEQYLMRMKAPRDEYEKLHENFNPAKYNPEEWVLMAKNAGMKYICFTTKHHDGFCMWDTKITPYNIMNTPYKKDVLKMLQVACEKHGIDLALYYSVPDWYNENAYNYKSTHQIPPRLTDIPDMEQYKEFVKKQVIELLSNYGKISMFFWDIPPHHLDETLNHLVRELQPNIIINNRGFDDGDFATPERYVPDGDIFTKPTQACESIGRQAWSNRINEDYYSYNLLKQNIDKIMCMGGNYLLNVGPEETGEICQTAKETITQIGNWYNKISCSFKEAKPVVLFKSKPELLTTINKSELYVHFYKGLNCSGIVLDPINVLPKNVTVLNTGETPKVSLDVIPTYYQREDAFVKYLHIYDMPCNSLSDEPVVLKLTFNDAVDIKDFFNKVIDNSETRL